MDLTLILQQTDSLRLESVMGWIVYVFEQLVHSLFCQFCDKFRLVIDIFTRQELIESISAVLFPTKDEQVRFYK